MTLTRIVYQGYGDETVSCESMPSLCFTLPQRSHSHVGIFLLGLWSSAVDTRDGARVTWRDRVSFL